MIGCSCAGCPLNHKHVVVANVRSIHIGPELVGGPLQWCWIFLIVIPILQALQSSEEARIAYRFTMLLDKMQNQLLRPDTHTPFKSLHDVIARLLPYHMWSEAEPPPGALEKGTHLGTLLGCAVWQPYMFIFTLTLFLSLPLRPSADAVYESVAQVLMSRSYGLMSQYQQLLYQDSPVRWDWGQVVRFCLKLAAWLKQFAVCGCLLSL